MSKFPAASNSNTLVPPFSSLLSTQPCTVRHVSTWVKVEPCHCLCRLHGAGLLYCTVCFFLCAGETLFGNVFAGMVAGTCASCIANPTDVLKVRLLYLFSFSFLLCLLMSSMTNLTLFRETVSDSCQDWNLEPPDYWPSSHCLLCQLLFCFFYPHNSTLILICTKSFDPFLCRTFFLMFPGENASTARCQCQIPVLDVVVCGDLSGGRCTGSVAGKHLRTLPCLVSFMYCFSWFSSMKLCPFSAYHVHARRWGESRPQFVEFFARITTIGSTLLQMYNVPIT